MRYCEHARQELQLELQLAIALIQQCTRGSSGHYISNVDYSPEAEQESQTKEVSWLIPLTTMDLIFLVNTELIVFGFKPY